MWRPPARRIAAPNLPGFMAFVFGQMGVPARSLPPMSGDGDFTGDFSASFGQAGQPTLGDTGDFSSDFSTDFSISEYAYNQWALWSFEYALEQVNLQIQIASPLSYLIAVYNLAGHILITLAIDPPNTTFFADARKAYAVNDFVAGVISASADVSTSESFVIADIMKDLSFNDLALLKTPWGQTYLGIAMKVGTMWGLT